MPHNPRPPRLRPRELFIQCVLALAFLFIVSAFVYYLGLVCGNMNVCFEW